MTKPRKPSKTPHTKSWPPPPRPDPKVTLIAIKGNYPDGIGKGAATFFLFLFGVFLTIFIFTIIMIELSS